MRRSSNVTRAAAGRTAVLMATQWDTVGIAFLAAGIAFVVGVLGLVAYFLRLPVSRVLRLTR